MSTQPSIADSGGIDSEINDGDESGGLVSTDGLGLSRRTLVLLALVVVAALVLWRLRSSEESSDGGDELEQALSEDMASDDDEPKESEAEIVVPAAPADELEKDAAVIEGLKKSGNALRKQIVGRVELAL